MRQPRLHLARHPHTASLAQRAEDTLDPIDWVPIDAWPQDNCMYYAVVIAQGIRRFLRKACTKSIQKNVDQLRENVATYMCNNPGAFGRMLFPDAGARLPRTGRLMPSSSTTSPMSRAAAAAVRAGMREFCLAVKEETCHGGTQNLMAIANTLKRRLCVYKMRGKKYVLTGQFGPRAAPKLHLLHAGSMAYMALVRCSALHVDGRSLCDAAPHWKPVRIPDKDVRNRNGFYFD